MSHIEIAMSHRVCYIPSHNAITRINKDKEGSRNAYKINPCRKANRPSKLPYRTTKLGIQLITNFKQFCLLEEDFKKQLVSKDERTHISIALNRDSLENWFLDILEQKKIFNHILIIITVIIVFFIIMYNFFLFFNNLFR